MTEGPAKKIGDIFLELKLITPAMLQKALEIQKTEYQPLGKILLKLGFITQEDLNNVLAKQFGSLYINPKTFTIRNRDLFKLIQETEARKYSCFPFDKAGDELTVVIEDPLDTDALCELNRITGLRIRPVHAKREVILEILDKYYALEKAEVKKGQVSRQKFEPTISPTSVPSEKLKLDENKEIETKTSITPDLDHQEKESQELSITQEGIESNQTELSKSDSKTTSQMNTRPIESNTTTETSPISETEQVIKRPWASNPPKPSVPSNIDNQGVEIAKKENKLPAPDFTFDNFVVGPSNQLAWAAAQNVVAQPGIGFNPLFIYGGVGLGKTHLANAIGNALMQQYPKAKIYYISIDVFVRELIHSIEHGDLKNFQNRYRNLDTLLIDDVQFLSRQERTQEEFFYIFEQLYRTNGQIIITSDRLPRQIGKLEDRLRTRFEGGLIVDIQSPDLETRIAIFRRKANSRGLNISDEIARTVATRLPSNIRELEGIANRILAQSQLMRDDLTQEMVKRILDTVVPLDLVNNQQPANEITRP